MIKYKSWLRRTLERVAWAFPLVSGLVDEDQRLSIPLCSNWLNPASGVRLARVDLDARLQIYSARMSARASLSGISYFWYHWRLTCAFLYVVMVWGFQVFWLAFWYVACLSRARCFRDSSAQDLDVDPIETHDDESVNLSPVMIPAASANTLNLAQTKVRKRRGKESK